MVKPENKITVTANALLWEFEADNDAPKNPFFRHEGELYLRFDCIKLTNASLIDGGGVEVGYYWHGIKMCIFPVDRISLEIRGLQSSLDLTGIKGAMRMVIINDDK